jgi:hypothetical protein
LRVLSLGLRVRGFRFRVKGSERSRVKGCGQKIEELELGKGFRVRVFKV